VPQLPHPLFDRFEKIVGKGRLVVLNGQLENNRESIADLFTSCASMGECSHTPFFPSLPPSLPSFPPSLPVCSIFFSNLMV